MGLSLYLEGPATEVDCYCRCCDNRHTREEREEYYSANITHNLCAMADEAGVYQLLWRPEEEGIKTARQAIEPLKDGMARLRAEPDRFRRLNPENGWGNYEGLVTFVENYLRACEDYPDAEIVVWR